MLLLIVHHNFLSTPYGASLKFNTSGSSNFLCVYKMAKLICSDYSFKVISEFLLAFYSFDVKEIFFP